MNKVEKLWKNLRKSLWESCEIAVCKMVEKDNFGRFMTFWLWNFGFNCGVSMNFCENHCRCSGKSLQIDKLYKSEVSTVST